MEPVIYIPSSSPLNTVLLNSNSSCRYPGPALKSGLNTNFRLKKKLKFILSNCTFATVYIPAHHHTAFLLENCSLGWPSCDFREGTWEMGKERVGAETQQHLPWNYRVE